jgi:tRNA threonylcarbamoyladenosine biosynthesis protein TsaB
MNLLAFDTSNNACGVALIKNDEYMGQILLEESNQQAESLFRLIDQILKKYALTYADLNAIATTIGPGSFTGIRIGIAAAKGLRLATKLPVLGLTTLEVIAYKIKNRAASEHIIPVITSHKGTLYTQIFNKDLLPVSEAQVLTEEEFVALVSPLGFTLGGLYSASLQDKLAAANINYNNTESAKSICPKSLALLGHAKFKANNFNTKLDPLYLTQAYVN